MFEQEFSDPYPGQKGTQAITESINSPGIPFQSLHEGIQFAQVPVLAPLLEVLLDAQQSIDHILQLRALDLTAVVRTH